MDSWRLYVDIGNSALKYGVWRQEQWLKRGALVHKLKSFSILQGQAEEDDKEARLISLWQALQEELTQAGMRLSNCAGVGVSSTCPEAAAFLSLLGEKVPCPIRRVGYELRSSIPTAYYQPEEIGADRWANVEAAVARYGAPVIVLDMGTGLTCEIVNAEKIFVGGMIALGLQPLIQGVAFVSERLRAIALAPEKETEPTAPGRSTKEALQRGLLGQLIATADYFAQAGLRAVGEAAPVLLTGGQAELCRRFMQTPTHHEPWLTLEGVRLMDKMDN